MNLIIRIFIFGCIFTISSVYGQDVNYKKILRKAQGYFNNEQYSAALPVFLKADSLNPSSFEVKYYIGACYLNMSNEQSKGIPYLEYALKHGENLLPKAVFADLGRLYHLNYQFDDAVEQFEKFLTLAEKKDYDENYVRRMVEICKNARRVVNDTLNVEIASIGQTINSDANEILPFISADESLLFFTRQFIKRFKGLDIDTISKIMYCENQNGRWTHPKEIILPADFIYSDINVTGISPDGQLIFFTAKTQRGYDLFYGTVINEKVDRIIPFPDIINSVSNEKSCSVTPDGQTLYFSSNRPGGYGGYDIYISHKNENGEWTEPENAGNAINSKYNDLSPFIHPDCRSLFFASDGHNTIGGYDIFISVFDPGSNSFALPTNIGFPVNTTYSDMFFVVSADGNHAYFSSARGSATGNHDIYKAVLQKNIPLTLVKGIITGGIPAKPIWANIRVIDKESGQKLKYVYNPNPKTGKYLMIFPPDKNYEMIIEAENYYPYRIEIYVPGQNYFYELFQEIHLDKVTLKNSKDIGQEITVRNIFFDVNKSFSDTLFKLNDTTAEKRYEKLLMIVEDIINKSDSLGHEKLERFSEEYINRSAKKDNNIDNLLNLIEQAIESSDSTMLAILDQTAIYQERTRKVYFYDALNQKPELSFLLVDGDTLWTLPNLDTRKDVIISKDTIKADAVKKSERYPDWEKMNIKKKVYGMNVYFETGGAEVKADYYIGLSDFIKIMLDNKNLVIEIEGYSDTRGDEVKNMDLSKDRAMNVLKYFLDNFIPTQRIRMTGYGESKSLPEKNEEELKQNRRVEVKLYEISY